MASLGDLTLFINAETNRASRDINDLGKQADKVSSKKRDIDFSLEKARNSIRNFKRDLATVGDTAKAAFKVAKMEGLLDDEIESAEILAKKVKQVGVGLNEARKPGQLLQRSFDGLAGSAVGIVNSLAKVGFALYGLQQVTGVLQQAFGGLFSGTVGEAVRLQESILKTQTALASTNDVIRNGEVITDPYEAIVALTGTIEKRIDSIRQRSLDLAGVTSQEVIEVFGMVAQQVGQIGGSLEDAEDLAISFAGALGTFGIPLYQARQEIGSILRGDITTDSYLAKALGITNEDVKKAKQSTEGVIGFLETKLATAVAGQKIAARSFSGVTSNIRDFIELIGEAFGKPLVQPLIEGLTRVYDLLVGVKDQALGAASALGGALAGASSILGGNVRGEASSRAPGGGGTQAADAAKAQVDALAVSIQALAADVQATFTALTLVVVRTFAKVGEGLKNLAVGFASLNVEVFKSLLESVTNLVYVVQPLVDGFGQLLTIYGELLQQPIVEYFAAIGAQFKLLETIGVNSLIKVALTAGALIAGFQKLKVAVVGVMSFIGKAFGTAATAAGAAMKGFAMALELVSQKLGVINPQLTATIAQLNAAGASATKAGIGMKGAAGGAVALGGGIKALMVGMLKFNLILLAVQLAVSAVVEAFARFQRAQKHAAAIEDMNTALEDLNATFADVDENSTAAEQALKEMADAKAYYRLIPEHPFGNAREQEQYARFLAKFNYQAVQKVISSVAKGMAFLQSYADALAREGRSVRWTTPSGFPAVQRYTKPDVKRVRIFLYDREAKMPKNTRMTLNGTGPLYDTRKARAGVAPNFVHSLDAAHMHLTICHALDHGIQDFFMIHDSFGTNAADTWTFYQNIRNAIVDMYEDNCVFENFEIECRHRLSNPDMDLASIPQKGDLDVTSVLESEYCFS